MATPSDRTRELITQCCREFGVSTAHVLGGGLTHGAVRARWAIIKRLREERGLTVARIGRVLGVAQTTVGRALRRMR